MVLKVADNGPGVPPYLQEKVFEPFFTTKPAGKGTGLGLAICRSIVRRHGGSITLSCTPGGGATFTIILPVGEPAFGKGERTLAALAEPQRGD
ncbi:MAG: sensor histidine kinase [Dehalococcoidia bacterium]